MTTVPKPRSQAAVLARVGARVLVMAIGWLSATVVSWAAQPNVHFSHQDALPPGAIGRAQLERGGPLGGYFQPVEILAPEGVRVSASVNCEFSDAEAAPFLAGMLLGEVYRLRVTGIPFHAGVEVYPTIEVINRLYPPIGMETKFPIPIELTQEELEMAIDGKFVVRVIYLEDPEAALPSALGPNEQTWFEALEGENPLEVADTLGRPMAILRLGGRVPDASGPDAAFMYGSPPLLRWQRGKPAQLDYVPTYEFPTAKRDTRGLEPPLPAIERTASAPPPAKKTSKASNKESAPAEPKPLRQPSERRGSR